jgi:NADPH-dependent glutamate synthase beta subunit-like oxidoreductase
MKRFTHHTAQSLGEAARVLRKYEGAAKAIAGGTDLLGVMRDRIAVHYPEAIIDLKAIQNLDYIKKDKNGLKIGALAKLADVAKSQLIKKDYPLLAEAAHSVASPHVRNMATMGGNLAQEVRCWYYRYPRHIGGPIVCLRKGGKVCDALAGDNRYHSIFGAAPLKEYPCSGHCPAKTAIPFYLSKVREGDYGQAARVLLEHNPIPALTGRVCPVFCEPNCNRKDVDEPVAIRCIERVVGDYALDHREAFFSAPIADSGKSVAIVGSGPAGLSAAFYLRRMGHAVTVYERLSEAGGMLMHAIPAYRLPKNVVDRQIGALAGMGIIFKTGVDVNREHLSRLAAQSDAVFVAAGAWKERPMGIEGDTLALSGLEFLNKATAGSRDVPGLRVAVVGGGNVAIDVARTLLRLGAKPVILYRRTGKEMPALKEEVKKGLEEGITFKFLTLPLKVARSGKDLAVTCVRMRRGARDASGRRSVAAVPGTEKVLHFDALIKAIGEEPDTALLPSDLPGKVFTGGDFATGPSTVIEAVAAGREGAKRIQEFLKAPGSRQDENDTGSSFVGPSSGTMPRVSSPELPASERIRSLDVEDVYGIGRQAAEQEASRCFNCGCLAVNPSDIAVALVALDATIVTSARTISAESFFRADAAKSTILDTDEIITGIMIPGPSGHFRQNYTKFTLRKPVDFSVVTAASVIMVDEEEICTRARIVLGAVASAPLKAVGAEEFLVGKQVTAETAEEAGRIALAGACPLSGNEYKVTIARTLVKRSLLGKASG